MSMGVLLAFECKLWLFDFFKIAFDSPGKRLKVRQSPLKNTVDYRIVNPHVIVDEVALEQCQPLTDDGLVDGQSAPP